MTSSLVAGVLVGSIILGGVSGAIVSMQIRDARDADAPLVPAEDVRRTDESAAELLPGSRESVRGFDEEALTMETVRRASPSVVSIVVTKELELRRQSGEEFPLDDFFDFGFPFDPFGFRPRLQPEAETPPAPRRERREVGGGSGFFISADGLVLTNKHVVADEEAEYTVVTNDNKEYRAKVVGRDPTNDLAVVKVEGRGFPVLALSNSTGLVIGQTVIAIGNSLSQYRNTVTKGVVSGIGRRVVAGDGAGSSEVIEEAIQTDAAINPGNSGGPLLNLKGEVVGINTAVNRGGQLIGFAIPANTAMPVVQSVKKFGRIIRPWLGVRYVLINERISKENNLPVKRGALVLRGERRTDLPVIPGSPADKAGIEENDIIVSVNGRNIDETHTLAREIQKYQPAEVIELKILRKGAEKILKVKLEEFKE